METTPEDKKKADMREYYAKNAEILKKKAKEYRIKNAEILKIKKKEYRLKNLERIKTQKKSHYVKNLELVKIRDKKYYIENSELIKIRNKEYRKKNSEKLKIKAREYRKNLYKNNPKYKMMRNLRARLHNVLKYQGVTKTETTLELCGETQEFVWNHLESQFKEGMTWENNNRKGWHIDHIIPMNSFDLSDPEERKKCCHYTNLQPLWWWENLEKADKIS